MKIQIINEITKMSVQPQHTRQTIVMKVLLLGQSNVGKTSLVTRYTRDQFEAQNNLLTVGIDIRKIEKQVNGVNILLELWDTAGQEKYKTIPSQYFKGIQGILLVYDITDLASFDRIQDWLDKVEQNSDLENVQMYLVGNKLDLCSTREVNISQAESFAKCKAMKFNQASAKLATNVQKIFMELASCILNRGIKCPIKHIRLDTVTNDRQFEEAETCCK